MECRAEINRFAIFLFCLLVPLGSMAPTETSESKVTARQRLKHFTREIPTYAVVIQQQAQRLFQFYNNCVSPSFHPEPLKVMSEGRNMADRIPKCLAFHANCCALHHINTILKTMGSHIETICKESSTDIVEANTIQLDTILSQGTVFYTCSSQDLTQEYPQGQDMGLADRKTYIWWVLKRYEDMMQLTKSQYSGGQKEKTT